MEHDARRMHGLHCADSEFSPVQSIQRLHVCEKLGRIILLHLTSRSGPMADVKDSYKPLRDADGLAAISRAIREAAAAAAQGGGDGGRQQDPRRTSAPLAPVAKARNRSTLARSELVRRGKARLC